MCTLQGLLVATASRRARLSLALIRSLRFHSEPWATIDIFFLRKTLRLL
jgi:hypothetical protein